MQTPPARATTGTAWMDFARVVAMVLVVLDHAVIDVAPLAERDTDDLQWWVAEPLLAVSRLAVPIFILVSGALLLDPVRTESWRSFARRRLHRVGVPLLVWALAYLTFRKDVLNEPLPGERALDDFAAGNPYYHLYYLYIALGLYAITPFLRRLVAVLDRRALVVLCALAFSLGMLDQFLRTVLQVGSSNGITLFVDYVGFYVAGWLLRDAGRGSRYARLAAPVLLAALVLVVLVTWALIVTGQGDHWFYPSTYLSPLVIVASIALYVVLQGARPTGTGATACRRLADLSLGTYLVHPMVLDLIRRETSVSRALGFEPLTVPPGTDGLLAWVGGLTAIGVLVGLAVTFLARLMPGVRRVF